MTDYPFDMTARGAPAHIGSTASPQAASERASRESAGPAKVVAAVATGSGSAEKRRWREYPAVQFSEADLPVWGYYPGRTHSVRLIDFMGNEMTHWMPARDDIPEAPTVRQPTPNVQGEPRPLGAVGSDAWLGSFFLFCR